MLLVRRSRRMNALLTHLVSQRVTVDLGGTSHLMRVLLVRILLSVFIQVALIDREVNKLPFCGG